MTGVESPNNRRQFIPVQRRLAERDLMADFTVHISSSVFAVLPGFDGGSYLGQRLLEG